MSILIRAVIIFCLLFLLGMGGVLYFGLFGFEVDKTGGLVRLVLVAVPLQLLRQKE